MPRHAVYPSEARLEGTTAVITGANTGVGKETARHLYRRGARVIIGVRSVERGEEARSEIVESAAGEQETAGALIVLQLDLASLQSVRDFAQEVLAQADKINLLINNAGVMACPRAETKEGFEMQLGVNHLGHFLLTLLLLERLVNSAPSRIVNLSSLAHTRGKMHFDDLMLKRGYGDWKAYYQSKLANVLFTRELARRLLGTRVTTYAVHPGIVRTDLWRHQGCFDRLLQPMFKTPEQGAQTTLYCALAPELATLSGRYYSDCKEKQPSARARNDEDAARLWEISEELVGVGLQGNSVTQLRQGSATAPQTEPATAQQETETEPTPPQETEAQPAPPQGDGEATTEPAETNGQQPE
ncbi:Retinol dehydrogenase 12 [Amphibalanus amphitrite]|uniref:Retinol dehydrogenase 12 n=1 Tax=Amphibalanus amphitrite TaxID=1232801 RepID=A0A6A4VL08_AMPAM|nr:Retinol dehydrogenase 12 [Amphibalanus amphitrite]